MSTVTEILNIDTTAAGVKYPRSTTVFADGMVQWASGDCEKFPDGDFARDVVLASYGFKHF